MFNEHIMNKMIELRKKGRSITEITGMLNLDSRAIISFLEITDSQMEKQLLKKTLRTPAQLAAAKKGSETVRLKHQLLRDNAYDQGKLEAAEVLKNKLLQDFVVMYLGEGGKKTREMVDIVNIDIAVLILSYKAMRLLSPKKIEVVIRYYPDQNFEELKKYWIGHFGEDNIKYTNFPKTKQTNKTGLRYYNTHGLISLRLIDTYAKCRLYAYIDHLKENWKKN